MFGSCFKHPHLGPQEKTVGGGGAAPVADAFSKQILTWLTQGFPGPQNTAGGQVAKADPIGQALAELLGGGKGAGDATKQVLDKQRDTDVANLRERYSMGGTGFGTPGASAETTYLNDFNPRAALAINEASTANISKAMQFLIPLLTQQAGLGTPQRQTVMDPGLFNNILSGAKGAASFIPGANMFSQGIQDAPDLGELKANL